MMKILLRVFLILFLSFFLYGHIYFWVDKTGTKHFTNVSWPLNERVEEQKESQAVFKKLSSPKNKHYPFTVVKIFDGDTLQVKGLDLIFTVRLVGIDCPEIGFNGHKDQPFSQRAKQYLIQLVDHKKVAIKSYGTDAYKRQLAEVFADNKNINLEIIKAGLAEVYKGRPPKKLDVAVYLKAAARARQTGRGMWVQGNSYKSPRQWRKENPRE